MRPIKNLNQALDNEHFITTASQFLGTPYLYGGRSFLGIDCAGLVQLCLLRGGIKLCPRDSKDQEVYFKKHGVPSNAPKRGDIVFFKGHVGIMLNEKQCLNATARHMTTLIEPIEDLVDVYGGITSMFSLSDITINS